MSEDTVQRLMGLALAWVEAKRAHDRGLVPMAVVEAARSNLESALREALMPAGWRLVPVEPTPQMVMAGMDGLGSCVGSCGEASPPDRSDIAYSYRAMLSAAPSAFPVELEQPEQPLGVSPQAGPRSLVAGLPTIADATCDGLSATPSASDANGR